MSRRFNFVDMRINTNKNGSPVPNRLICAGQGEHARLLIGVRHLCGYTVYDYHSGLEVVTGKFINRMVVASIEIMEPYTNGSVPFPCDKIEQDDVTEAYCTAWFERARVGRVKSIKVLNFKTADL